MHDLLGSRIKTYESYLTPKLMIGLPIIARIDGIGFSKFTKNLEKPYDKNLSSMMIETSMYLLQEFGANCAYTQSDEISLGWYIENTQNTEPYGGYRIQKLVSHLSAKTTWYFNKLLPLINKSDTPCYFDARVFNVPNLTEAVNTFIWREQDAIRNSIQGAARKYYSHKQCFNKNCKELLQMLKEKNINWDDYPHSFKYGTLITKRKIIKKFTTKELELLPEKHEARKNPELNFERTEYFQNQYKLIDIKNKKETLFLGEEAVS